MKRHQRPRLGPGDADTRRPYREPCYEPPVRIRGRRRYLTNRADRPVGILGAGRLGQAMERTAFARRPPSRHRQDHDGERRQSNPNRREISVSTEQRENLEAVLRQSAFPVDSDVNEQRRLLRELISVQPLPADVTVAAAALGGVPAAEITIDGIEPRHVVLYFHGGVYVLGDAFLAADLASQVGRRTAPRSSPSTTGSPPSTRIRPRSTTLWQPTKPSCKPAPPLRTSPSWESPPAAGSPSPPWSTPAITGCPCQPPPSSCHRMPISRWPGRPCERSTRSTRC